MKARGHYLTYWHTHTHLSNGYLFQEQKWLWHWSQPCKPCWLSKPPASKNLSSRLCMRISLHMLTDWYGMSSHLHLKVLPCRKVAFIISMRIRCRASSYEYLVCSWSAWSRMCVFIQLCVNFILHFLSRLNACWWAAPVAVTVQLHASMHMYQLWRHVKTQLSCGCCCFYLKKLAKLTDCLPLAAFSLAWVLFYALTFPFILLLACRSSGWQCWCWWCC